MPLTNQITIQLNPQPFGNVSVVTPGVPVQLSINLPNLSPPVTQLVTDHVPCNKINVNASTIAHSGAGNTGKVYVGASNMVRATLAGVICVLSPGQGFQITNNVGMNTYQLDQWYVDADNAGDGVYGSFDVV